MVDGSRDSEYPVGAAMCRLCLLAVNQRDPDHSDAGESPCLTAAAAAPRAGHNLALVCPLAARVNAGQSLGPRLTDR
jgi:hypothetical protein